MTTTRHPRRARAAFLAGLGLTLTGALALVPLGTAHAGSATAPAPIPVSIVNFAFSPASAAIPVGATVEWTNDDRATHTVTANDGSFNHLLPPGAHFSWTFTAANPDFAYHCNIHTAMTGLIVVQVAATPAPGVTTSTAPTTTTAAPTTTTAAPTTTTAAPTPTSRPQAAPTTMAPMAMYPPAAPPKATTTTTRGSGAVAHQRTGTPPPGPHPTSPDAGPEAPTAAATTPAVAMPMPMPMPSPYASGTTAPSGAERAADVPSTGARALGNPYGTSGGGSGHVLAVALLGAVGAAGLAAGGALWVSRRRRGTP